jgi:hypothetical protein
MNLKVACFYNLFKRNRRLNRAKTLSTRVFCNRILNRSSVGVIKFPASWTQEATSVFCNMQGKAVRLSPSYISKIYGFWSIYDGDNVTCQIPECKGTYMGKLHRILHWRHNIMIPDLACYLRNKP